MFQPLRKVPGIVALNLCGKNVVELRKLHDVRNSREIDSQHSADADYGLDFPKAQPFWTPRLEPRKFLKSCTGDSIGYQAKN